MKIGNIKLSGMRYSRSNCSIEIDMCLNKMFLRQFLDVKTENVIAKTSICVIDRKHHICVCINVHIY